MMTNLSNHIRWVRRLILTSPPALWVTALFAFATFRVWICLIVATHRAGPAIVGTVAVVLGGSLVAGLIGGFLGARGVAVSDIEKAALVTRGLLFQLVMIACGVPWLVAMSAAGLDAAIGVGLGRVVVRYL
jgi:hypothetical protein